MEKFFDPRSVAVFGVSDKPANLASGVLYNLSLFNWHGRVYAVGARECEVAGTPVHSSVLDIDDTIDVAVVLAPAKFTPAILRDWWNTEIQGRGLTIKSGRVYLDVLSSVFGYAQDLGILESNPTDAFRASLRRRTRTQRGRKESEAGRHARPIEEPEEVNRLVEAARADRGEPSLRPARCRSLCRIARGGGPRDGHCHRLSRSDPAADLKTADQSARTLSTYVYRGAGPTA